MTPLKPEVTLVSTEEKSAVSAVSPACPQKLGLLYRVDGEGVASGTLPLRRANRSITSLGGMIPYR